MVWTLFLLWVRRLLVDHVWNEAVFLSYVLHLFLIVHSNYNLETKYFYWNCTFSLTYKEKIILVLVKCMINPVKFFWKFKSHFNICTKLPQIRSIFNLATQQSNLTFIMPHLLNNWFQFFVLGQRDWKMHRSVTLRCWWLPRQY